MFRDGEQSRRLMHEDATSDEEAEEAQEREEREREGAQEEEEEEEEEEEPGPEVKALIDEVAAVITTIELNEDRYLTKHNAGYVDGYMQEHNMWQGVLNHLQLREMPIAQADIHAFLKKILTRRKLARDVRRLRSHGSDENKGWMIQIKQHYTSVTKYEKYETRKKGLFPWHGENPAECKEIDELSVRCTLDKYHKEWNIMSLGLDRPLWLRSWSRSTPPKPQPIDELMHEGRVFSDGGQQVWVNLTEKEFSNMFSGKYRGRAIDEYMEKGLLKRVHPRTPPHISGMRPFREYRPCAYEDPELAAGKDPELDEEFYTEGADDKMADEGEGAAGGMSEGGNRAQKKHKTKHKTKCKTKSKCKTKRKSKCKTKTKTKSKCKTKSKSKLAKRFY